MSKKRRSFRVPPELKSINFSIILAICERYSGAAHIHGHAPEGLRHDFGSMAATVMGHEIAAVILPALVDACGAGLEHFDPLARFKVMKNVHMPPSVQHIDLGELVRAIFDAAASLQIGQTEQQFAAEIGQAAFVLIGEAQRKAIPLPAAKTPGTQF